ncbi:MAG: YIP1 family protein [Methyloceanibacter sp.]|nr:YIP1 family protein [Methyloceanibacter sp.]
MDLIPTPEARAALLARIKGILLQPKDEWPKIDAEPATIGGIYSSYVVYLVAVPVLCTLIGSLVFGYGFAGVTYRPSIAAALTTAVLQYGLQLGGVYIFALIIEALSPRFGGNKDRVSAFKLAAYSATASWLAGVFALVPGLGILSLLGLYSLYLLYTGVPILMKVPADKALPYTAAIIVIGIILGLVAGALSTCMLPSRGPATQGELSGKLNLPGGVSVDMGKLDQAAKRMESMGKQMGQPNEGAPSGAPSSTEDDAARLPPIPPGDLKTLLPKSLPGGFARTDVSTAAGGAAGLAFGTAKATYTKGNAHITLSLMDMGAMGALATLGSAFGANATEETATSYSKMGEVDGRMTMEKFDKETKDGTFGVVVKDRVMVEAEGNGASMAALKSAVGAIDLGSVEALANK